MSRVDVPTLKCDRCRRTTQDLSEMAVFRELTYYGMEESKNVAWDLCPACWGAFIAFLDGDA